MIASRTKVIASGGILLVLVALGGLYAYATSTQASPGAGRIELKYTEDFNDDKKVVEKSEAVFVAKVTRFVEHTYFHDLLPVSVFEAEVIHSIKGDAEGTVRLVQDAQFYYDNEGWRLMQPGETYVFAASFDEGDNGGPEGYVILSHQNGSKLLSKDAKKSKDDLAQIAENDEKVKAWKAVAK
jgi:hypothetical protein